MIWHNGIMIDRKNRTITHNFHTEDFSLYQYRGKYVGSYRFEAVERLIMQPASCADLYNMFFGHLECGGPEVGPHIFQIRFSQWRPVFKRLSLRLRREKTSGLLHYSLVPHVT